MYGGKWWMQYFKNMSCHKHLALLIFHAIKSISPTLIITSNLSSFLVIKEMLFPSYNFFVIKQIYLLPIWSPDVIHFRCNKIYIEYIFLLQEKLRTLDACDSCVYEFLLDCFYEYQYVMKSNRSWRFYRFQGYNHNCTIYP